MRHSSHRDAFAIRRSLEPQGDQTIVMRDGPFAISFGEDNEIGDAAGPRVDSTHLDTLGPMADEVGIVVDVSETGGVETLVVA